MSLLLTPVVSSFLKLVVQEDDKVSLLDIILLACIFWGGARVQIKPANVIELLVNLQIGICACYFSCIWDIFSFCWSEKLL